MGSPMIFGGYMQCPRGIMYDVSSLFRKVNADWQRGYCDGRTGSFPAAFVQSFPSLTLPPGGKVFLCTEEFPLLQQGDLAINPG